jgi:hypothetical protein
VEGEVDYAYNEPTLFETLDHDSEKMPQIAWVDYSLSYGFKNEYEYMGNGVSRHPRFTSYLSAELMW